MFVRILLSASLLILTQIISHGQTIIEMEEHNGSYRVPCLINDIRMKLIFDTGATDLCLSDSIVEYLIDNEYLSLSDFCGESTVTVANGNTYPVKIINIRTLEICGLQLYNVKGLVIQGQSAPLLLGMNVIQQLGRVEIDGNRLVIYNNIDNPDIDDLLDLAHKYRTDGFYSKAKECYDKIYYATGLTDYGLYEYALCCMFTKDFILAKQIIDKIHDYNWFSNNDINIYSSLAWVYQYNNLYDDAIAYYQKAFDLDIPSNNYKERSYFAMQIADIYYFDKESYTNAMKNYQLSIRCIEFEHNLRDNYIFDEYFSNLRKGENKSYRTEDLDWCVLYYIKSMFYEGLSNKDSYLSSLKILAKNGNSYAIKECNKQDISY